MCFMTPTSPRSPLEKSEKGKHIGYLARRWVFGLLAMCGCVGLLVAVQWMAARRPESEQRKLLIMAQSTYPQWCAPCHGGALEGLTLGSDYVAPPLNKPTFRWLFATLPSAMENWMREQIAEGTGVATMPHFDGVLPREQIEALAFYIEQTNLVGASH